jgi:hypothetical protein
MTWPTLLEFMILTKQARIYDIDDMDIKYQTEHCYDGLRLNGMNNVAKPCYNNVLFA